MEQNKNKHKIRSVDSAMISDCMLKKTSFAILLCVILSVALLIKWCELLSPTDKIVFRSIAKVYVSFYTGKITGAYWINEVADQGACLMDYTDIDRILFYRNIVRKFPLEDSNATIFVMTIGNDLKLVRNDLVDLQKTPTFDGFTKIEKKRICQWVDELDRAMSSSVNKADTYSREYQHKH